MKKIICDKCGKEFDDLISDYWIDKPNKEYEVIDLCEGCFKKWAKIQDETFIKWLRGEK